MADQLYLSLWFPNFRLESLPATLTGVLRQFATIAGDARVRAASAYPIDFTESPTYQRIFVTDERADDTPDTAAAHIDHAVAEATEQLHDDMAYEFEMTWNLWLPDPVRAPQAASTPHPDDADDLDDSFDDLAPRTNPPIPFPASSPEPPADRFWKLRPSVVRILGFGPQFDAAGYTQNGHIRVDFGLDTPWTMETVSDPPSPSSSRPASPHPEDLAATTAKHIQQNVEMLLAFTLLVEKHCNLSSRLLWTESGEPLAEKLIASLQRLH